MEDLVRALLRARDQVKVILEARAFPSDSDNSEPLADDTNSKDKRILAVITHQDQSDSEQEAG